MAPETALPDPLLDDPKGTLDERRPIVPLPPRTKLGQRVRHEAHACGGTISLVGTTGWDMSSLWECDTCGGTARRNQVWTGP